MAALLLRIQAASEVREASDAAIMFILTHVSIHDIHRLIASSGRSGHSGRSRPAASGQSRSLADQHRDSMLASQHMVMAGRDIETVSPEMRDPCAA